jgi:hypothetical protein
MAKKFGIDIKRKSKLPEFNDRVKDMANSHVKIGILEEAGAHQGDGEVLTVADVASFHEFGTENAPERSFIRATINEQRDDLKTLSKKLQAAILTGKMSAKQALGLMGEKMQAEMINKINEGIEPELDPKTIKRKGSSTPLIDTGQLKQSIRYKVEE